MVATDANGDPLALSGTGTTGYTLPDFVTFTDTSATLSAGNGNGTGVFHITPDINTNSGDYTIYLTATENRIVPLGAENSTTTNFLLSLNAPNDRPKFSYQGDIVAIPGTEIAIPIYVVDKNQDALTYSISGLPSGAVITPTSTYGKAILTWTPTEADLNTYPVTITVTDVPTARFPNTPVPEPLSNTQTFNLVVRSTNAAPVLGIIGNRTTSEESKLTFQLSGTDLDTDKLTYTATNLPTGSKLDPQTGLFTWTPIAGQAGDYSVKFTTSDGNKSNSETVKLTVTHTNHNPILTPLPLQRGSEQKTLTFNLIGNDVDGDSLLFTIDSVKRDGVSTSIPQGVYLDQNTGKFVWTPSYNQAGEYTFKFATIDAYGGRDSKEIKVLIDNVDRAPTLNISDRGITIGTEVKFVLDGKDLDLNTVLTYATNDLPAGATLNASTGEFKWTPSAGQLGSYIINFSVSDGEIVTSKTATIKVQNRIEPPKVTLDLTPSFPVLPGQKVIVTTLADSIADIADIKVKVDGILVDSFKYNSSRNGGNFTFTSSQTGRHQLEIIATDVDGQITKIDKVIKVKDLSDTTAPFVELASGLNGAKLTANTQITGQIVDANLDEWKLEIAELGTENYRVVTSGYTPVLTTYNLQPTTYQNGFYNIRLTATDISGRTSVSNAVVEVNTATKSGYQNTTTDLSLTLGGIPVNLTRHYDANSGKWTFNYDPHIQLNLSPLPLPLSPFPPLKSDTRLYLNTPTGERVGFTFTPIKHDVAGGAYYTPNWVADAGVNYTLQSVDAKLMLAGGKFYDLETAIPYNPGSGSSQAAEYTLIATNGTKYELDAQRGLVGQIAANGMKLIYSDAGIITSTTLSAGSSTGEVVQFVKDKTGNITQVIAPNGTQLSYEYNAQGDLVSVRNSATGEVQKYGYEAVSTTAQNSSIQRLTVISSNAGGTVINYGGTGFTTESITKDLGGIANFNGQTITITTATHQVYSFNLKPAELNTTNSHTVLIGIEGAGDVLINGVAPVYTSGNYRIFAVDQVGINLLEITNPGATFKLSLVGDLNSDNRVDGVDTQLLTSTSYDLNRDGVSNALDLQLLGGNYGFVGNSAPVITPVVSLTHVDLTARIDLSKLAVDGEGDKVAFSVKSGVHGQVEISADGQYAIFTPERGYGGTGGFELIASDGFSSSKANIDVNVSTAALVNLDITNRNPKLQVGDKYQLQVIGDFTDQYGVELPAEYVNFAVNSPVISVNTQGLVTGLIDGTGLISLTRNGISAFTATRVGTFTPTTALDSLIKDGETKGLNAYPGIVTLIPGMHRQILVSTFSAPQNPNSLTDSTTGTKYYVSNPNILEVSSSGLITAKQTGTSTVTVINQGAESVLFIEVSLPSANDSKVGINGGAIQTTDGSLVTIAPGSIVEDTPVSIQQLDPAQISLPLPPNYQVVGAFNLNLGDTPLLAAAQIGIKAPTGLAIGTEVFFLQKGELPNEQGVMQPIWLLQESGTVGDDGMIRTSSPPWNGITSTGEYTVVIPTFNYSRIDVEANITKIATLYTGALTLALISGGLGVYIQPQSVFLGFVAKFKVAATLLPYTAKLKFGISAKLKLGIEVPINLPFGADDIQDVYNGSLDILAHIPALLDRVVPKPQVSVINIPTYGLPYTTTAGVEFNPGQIPTAKVDIVPRASGNYQPAISSVEVKVVDLAGSPTTTLAIEGQNYGTDLTKLKVDLISATGEIINLPIITDLSTLTKLVVRPSNLLPINSQSHLQITRTYLTAYQPIPTTFKSELVNLPDEPLYRDLSLIPLTWGNKIAVYNTTDPKSVIASSPVGSPDLLLAKIPVGKAGITSDGPRFVAVNSDATVAYTPLEGEGRVAVIDLISLQQVNTNHGAIDPTIALPVGAKPFSIVIGALDKYAYVADRYPANGIGQIYVIDIDPRSVTYNKHIQTIQIGTNLTELSQMALSRDGKSLFITAPKATDSRGHIIAVNVDITTKGDFASLWHQQVGDLVTNLGVTGISAAPIVDSTQPNRVQMVITNRQDDNYGFGVITVENGNFSTANINYTPLLLGAFNDYFDVNEAVAVTMTSDGKYAFVAGKNSRNMGRLIPSVDADSRAGSNIGIISNPLTSNAKLVAATLPIPNGWVNGLALSGDGKVLTAVYQGLGSGSIFAFDVEAMIKTVEHPELFLHSFLGESNYIFNDQTRPATIEDLKYVPIDRINPAIDQIGADFVRGNLSNGQVFGVPIGSKAPPVLTGGNTFSVTAASDWLNLTPVSATGYTEDLTPTLSWQIDNNHQVNEVDLFISTYGAGEGLLPWDELVNLDDTSFLPSLSSQQKKQLLTRDWHGLDDYNPGRTLTATWKRSTNQWTLADGTLVAAATGSDPANTMSTFTVPNSVILTTGGRLNWAVRATDTLGKSIVETGKFEPVAPLSTTPFASVSVLTQGFTISPGATGIGDWVYEMGNSIIKTTGDAPGRQGLLLQFEKKTGTWVPVTVNKDNKAEVLTTITGGLSTGDANYWSTLAANIKTYYQHKPLVLMNEWALEKESIIPDSGFTEGAADDLFAAMVRLDKALGGGVGQTDANGQTRIYDDNGQLIRIQGDIFNSPLHFIGHSRGTVVTSEIIQRLGTYFPNAGGAINADGSPVLGTNGKPVRDLQMTTLDPHDFDQPSLALNFKDFKEPKIQIWDNVTFADNYYQTLGDELALISSTPNGRDIPNLRLADQAKINNTNGVYDPKIAGLYFPRDNNNNVLGKPDISKDMNDLTGTFLGLGNQLGDPHGEVVKWYAKTVDVNLNKLGVDGRFTDQPGTYTPNTAIYDRLGESDLASFFGNNSILLPPFKREGNGEGWYYSVLGGGKSDRQYTGTRVPVSWDNTLQARSRGDFAVPTLFNGNFDAEFENPSPLSVNGGGRFGVSNAIAGWSFRNNATGATWANNVVNNGYLKDWKDIPTFADSNGYLSKLGIDPTAANYQPNYAIELNSSRNTITHNRFLVPDWGALRFDLFTGAINSSTTGTLKVFLDALDGSSASEIDEILLQKAAGTPAQYMNDTHKIGYGETGFETFMIDIPDDWRGKVGTLRFELNGSTQPVYLDNVFFKSQSLFLGNPTEARKPDGVGSYISDYLLEKPQFTVSYNETTKNPNWVAWQLNKSWLGSKSKRVDFFADTSLPSNFTTITHNDYFSSIDPKRTDYDRGHMIPSSQRTRILKDNVATYTTTNVVPQSIDNNRLFFIPQFDWSAWYDMENYAKRLANTSREIYTFAGGLGSNPNPQLKSNGYPQFQGTNTDPTRLNTTGINIPEWTWKTMLVLEHPIQNVLDITSNSASYTIITPNTAEPLPSAFNNGQTVDNPLNQILSNHRSPITSLDQWRSWETWRVTLNELESVLPSELGFNFLSNVARNVRDVIKDTLSPVIAITSPGAEISQDDSGGEGDDLTAPLLTNESISLHTLFPSYSLNNYPAIWQGGITKGQTIQQPGIEVDRSREIDITNVTRPGSITQFGTVEVTANKLGITQTGFGQVGISQVGISQVGISQVSSIQVGSSQVGSSQVGSSQFGIVQINPTEISLPSSITLQQLLSSHNPNLQNTTVPTWTEFLQSPTPFNLKIEVTDLPSGQLAEATITGYDTNGRPNSGTLTLDTDGNSLGWFIDTTPDDNTEFDQTLTTTAYRATTGAASGKYDLLTTILHELGHLNGIIRGNSAFDTHVQNINGIPTFINGGITAQLTPDGSHLDSTLYPYDLMNTSLKPGVRKLPSALDLSILNTIWSNKATSSQQINTTANLTAGALIGITNGDFTTPTTWNTLGATNIINGTATLTEQSQKLSELTQAFIIPTGAKTLQFTIKDNHLITGDTTKTANDAFEVALLDTNTFNPLAGTSIGLNHTDSLLNIQANGTIHKSDKVTITALSNNSSIVSIDLTQVTPSTQATLYFNLLGFGARTSTVTIDDVKLFTDTQPIPVTKNDTLTTNQNTPLTLDPTQLTTNDTNVTQIQIINQPTHGTLTQTPDGKLTYTPVPTYIGNDSFTYLGFGSDGQISNLATVNITINNLPPTIETLTIPTKINEGQNIQLSATAKDGGSSDNLTYTWNLGDGSNPITGQNIAHTYTDNGNYDVTLTVTDVDGGSTSRITTVKVDNLAPIVNVTAPTTNLNQGETLNLSVTYSDSGIKDTHTITWNFGDGSDPVTLAGALGFIPQPNLQSHVFTKAGNHNVTVTVTDNDGASTTDTIQVTVTNLPPTINSVNIPTNINEGSTVQLTATASDAGNDTLTYNWYINGATTPIIGQTIDYKFANSGSYPVKLDVIDSNGAITTQTVDVTITNVAPTINQIIIPTNIKEGEIIQLQATASDAGNDALIYNWYINNSITPITGATIDYTFTDNGIYPVKLEVIDTDGAITTQTVDVTVANVAPAVASILKPDKINEGESVAFTATATDAGINDTLTYSWNFGDNTNPVNGQNVNHIFTDNGNYDVVLTVTDKDGAATTQTVAVTVDNVAPVVVSIDKPNQINEGESVVFTATATDAGINDTLTYSWNFGDTTTPVSGQNVNHTFADNGNYNVVLTVTDKDGAVTTQTVVVKVDNVAPVVVSIAKPNIIKEGELITFSATATDAGIDDTLTYSWNFGDNTNLVIGQNVNHIFTDNGNYNVTLTVTDKDGGVITESVAVTVDNVAPTVVSILKPSTIKEGESVTFSATASDPGILDTLTYSWNFGDNTSPVTGQNATHTFADNGNYNVTVSVTDKDGAATTQTVVAKVDNVAPMIVNIIKPTTIKEGESAIFAATANDPGILDPLTYVWNFGDNTTAVSGQNVNHTFADNGNYNVTLTVTDKDGGVTTQTVVAKVDNVAPIVVSIAKPTTIKEGESVTFSATVTDPGILDTLTYSWNFGDNTNPVVGQNVNHTFTDNGNYNVTLTVADKDGAITTQTIIVKVDNVAPIITNITIPPEIKTYTPATFTATATDVGITDILTYTWNFGDGTNPVVGQNSSHTFTNPGTYNISLTVTDNDGGTSTTTIQTITVLSKGIRAGGTVTIYR